MKKIIIIILLMLQFPFVYGEVVDLNELHSYEMLYEEAKELVSQYPKILKMTELGYSTDGRIIFAIIMTENVYNVMRLDEGYVEKMHFFFEGGIHSRENPGPVVLLKSIELYCQDYYDDQVIEEFSVSEILKDHVLHFVPISNPDGYELSNRGLYKISKENQEKLLSFKDQNFRSYKSNVNGVDLNRNFPGLYYDVSTETWLDIWNKVHNEYRSYRPSGAFYPGPYAGSEIETQIMMDYTLKYDFRSYISYHSKGMVIYYNKWMLSNQHNETTLRLAKVIENYSKYNLINNAKYESSSGYITDFTAMQTLKPSITVESVYWTRTLPVNQSVIIATFDEIKYLPLHVVMQGEAEGYYKYKWYKDGRYVRDFEEYVYAKAIADKYGGEVLIYSGLPILYQNIEENPVRRIDLIELIMTYIDADKMGPEFLDCKDESVLKARALGIVSGYNNEFRPKDFVTYEEVYVILSKAFFKDYELKKDYQISIRAQWAVDSIKILIENEVLDLKNVLLGRITLRELKAYLDVILFSGG